MTTEITIDEATAALLKKGADAEHMSFQEAAAAALRTGAQSRFGPGEKNPPKASLTNLKELAAQIQNEEDLERIRRTSG